MKSVLSVLVCLFAAAVAATNEEVQVEQDGLAALVQVQKAHKFRTRKLFPKSVKKEIRACKKGCKKTKNLEVRDCDLRPDVDVCVDTALIKNTNCRLSCGNVNECTGACDFGPLNACIKQCKQDIIGIGLVAERVACRLACHQSCAPAISKCYKVCYANWPCDVCSCDTC